MISKGDLCSLSGTHVIHKGTFIIALFMNNMDIFIIHLGQLCIMCGCYRARILLSSLWTLLHRQKLFLNVYFLKKLDFITLNFWKHQFELIIHDILLTTNWFTSLMIKSLRNFFSEENLIFVGFIFDCTCDFFFFLLT